MTITPFGPTNRTILCCELFIRQDLQEVKKKKRNAKAIPVQAWTGPEGSRKLTVPRFHDNGTGWW